MKIIVETETVERIVGIIYQTKDGLTLGQCCHDNPIVILGEGYQVDELDEAIILAGYSERV